MSVKRVRFFFLTYGTLIISISGYPYIVACGRSYFVKIDIMIIMNEKEVRIQLCLTFVYNFENMKIN